MTAWLGLTGFPGRGHGRGKGTEPNRSRVPEPCGCVAGGHSAAPSLPPAAVHSTPSQASTSPCPPSSAWAALPSCSHQSLGLHVSPDPLGLAPLFIYKQGPRATKGSTGAAPRALRSPSIPTGPLQGPHPRLTSPCASRAQLRMGWGVSGAGVPGRLQEEGAEPGRQVLHVSAQPSSEPWQQIRVQGGAGAPWSPGLRPSSAGRTIGTRRELPGDRKRAGFSRCTGQGRTSGEGATFRPAREQSGRAPLCRFTDRKLWSTEVPGMTPCLPHGSLLHSRTSPQPDSGACLPSSPMTSEKANGCPRNRPPGSKPEPTPTPTMFPAPPVHLHLLAGTCQPGPKTNTLNPPHPQKPPPTPSSATPSTCPG